MPIEDELEAAIRSQAAASFAQSDEALGNLKGLFHLSGDDLIPPDQRGPLPPRSIGPFSSENLMRPGEGQLLRSIGVDIGAELERRRRMRLFGGTGQTLGQVERARTGIAPGTSGFDVTLPADVERAIMGNLGQQGPTGDAGRGAGRGAGSGPQGGPSQPARPMGDSSLEGFVGPGFGPALGGYATVPVGPGTLGTPVNRRAAEIGNMVGSIINMSRAAEAIARARQGGPSEEEIIGRFMMGQTGRR